MDPLRKYSASFSVPAILMLLGLLITACSTPIQVKGSSHDHFLFSHPAKTNSVTTYVTMVYIEGDGVPWIARGTQPAKDPTPFHPLAYNLFKKTPEAAWYVTRPCYNRVRDSSCSNQLWTNDRYSEEIVASMTSVIQTALLKHPSQKLVLVGYSGGGTLAVLIAPRIQQVIGVITVSGNLDITAWTTLHGYQPLTGSLNPADLAPLTVPVIAMIGDKDSNIPYASLSGFLQRNPHTIVQQFSEYDHVCCWEKKWPTLLHSALANIKLEPTN